jgi:hypothetical protein
MPTVYEHDQKLHQDWPRKSNQGGWMGNVQKMGELRNAYKAFAGKPEKRYHF